MCIRDSSYTEIVTVSDFFSPIWTNVPGGNPALRECLCFNFMVSPACTRNRQEGQEPGAASSHSGLCSRTKTWYGEDMQPSPFSANLEPL